MGTLSGVRAGWGQWVSRCYISAPAQRSRDSSLWDQGNTSNQYPRLPSLCGKRGRERKANRHWVECLLGSGIHFTRDLYQYLKPLSACPKSSTSELICCSVFL